jgi:hypothetical protein
MNGLVARIILRYVAGALIAKGLLADADGDWINADPDLLQAVTAGIGIAIGAVTEVAYRLAKRWGWRT